MRPSQTGGVVAVLQALCSPRRAPAPTGARALAGGVTRCHGCFPPRPSPAWRPPRYIPAHPPSEPRLPGNNLMPVKSPLPSCCPCTSSPRAMNGRIPRPAPRVLLLASHESTYLTCNHRMEVSGPCCASGKPQLPISGTCSRSHSKGGGLWIQAPVLGMLRLCSDLGVGACPLLQAWRRGATRPAWGS